MFHVKKTGISPGSLCLWLVCAFTFFYLLPGYIVFCQILRKNMNFLYERRSSQLYTQLLQLRIESLKNIQAFTRFAPLTSAIPVQRTSLNFWLVSLIDRALHRYRRGRVRIPYKPEFFSSFLLATAKIAYITAMIFLHIIFHSAVHIYDFSYVHNFIIWISVSCFDGFTVWL